MTAIFTVAEAKAFKYQGQTPLATGFSDEEIQVAADRITADFAEICDVSFVPVAGEVATLDGNGDPYLPLPKRRVTAVTALEYWSGSAWVASDLAYRLMDDGSLLGTSRWPWGRGNLRLTYTHGYATPPAPIVRAALILAVDQLTGSNVSDRATQQTNNFGTYNLAVPGWRESSWFGLPVVDSVLARFSERGPGVG